VANLFLFSNILIGQNTDSSKEFINECFLESTYKAVVETVIFELNEDKSLKLKSNQIKISRNLSDTLYKPIWLGKVYQSNIDYRSLDFDSNMKTNSKDTIRQKQHNSYTLVENNIPIQVVANQGNTIDLNSCSYNCTIELSFSKLFLQDEHIFGYVYINYLNQNIYKNDYDEPLIFELDNWDNLIKINVRPLIEIFEESRLILYTKNRFYQKPD